MRNLIVACCIAMCTSCYAGDGVTITHEDINRASVEVAIGTVAGLTIDNKTLAWAAAMAPTVVYETYQVKHDPDYKVSVRSVVVSSVGAAIGVNLGHWIIRPNKIIYKTQF